MGGGSGDAAPIKVYRRRFYMLAVMVLNEFLNNSIFVSFAPIAGLMQSHFNKVSPALF
jgi:hypothetical protein